MAGLSRPWGPQSRHTEASYASPIGYFAKISSTRLNAFSAAACGAMWPCMMSVQATLQTCSLRTYNAMMATAIIYALPPIAIFYALRRYMAAGLTTGSVKG